MHLAFDIFQGIGVAAAVGIRPLLPALAVGALASGDVQIHFDHSNYHFLQQAPFLLAIVVCAILLALAESRMSPQMLSSRPVLAVTAILAAVIGALLFGGALARGHYASWPGNVGGVVCALTALAATRPILKRARGRLEEAGLLALFAEVAAVLAAVLSVLGPPIGVLVLLALLWLLYTGRRQEGQKYAGLRILR